MRWLGRETSGVHMFRAQSVDPIDCTIIFDWRINSAHYRNEKRLTGMLTEAEQEMNHPLGIKGWRRSSGFNPEERWQRGDCSIDDYGARLAQACAICTRDAIAIFAAGNSVKPIRPYVKIKPPFKWDETIGIWSKVLKSSQQVRSSGNRRESSTRLFGRWPSVPQTYFNRASASICLRMRRVLRPWGRFGTWDVTTLLYIKL